MGVLVKTNLKNSLGFYYHGGAIKKLIISTAPGMDRKMLSIRKKPDKKIFIPSFLIGVIVIIIISHQKLINPECIKRISDAGSAICIIPALLGLSFYQSSNALVEFAGLLIIRLAIVFTGMVFSSIVI